MKKLFIFLVFSYVFDLAAADLKVIVDSMENTKGDILFLIFNGQDGFPDNEKKSVYQGKISAKQANEEGILIKDLNKGQYAISLFHDQNINNKLDVSLFGMPKEGFGFSNNPRILFGPPSFKKARFKLDKDSQQKIKLIYF